MICVSLFLYIHFCDTINESSVCVCSHSGGFGVAKNLSDWAVKNKDCTVQPDVEKIIKAFHKAGKPLGMCCISPILAAKVLPGCEITVGQDKECEK